MHRGFGLLVAVLLVASMIGLPAPVGAETRVDHGDDGFTIHDNGTLVAPAGGVVGVEQGVHLHPVGESTNTGNFYAVGFIVDPPADRRAKYIITVEYDRQVHDRIVTPVGPVEACGAELHMRLVDTDENVEAERTGDCIDDLWSGNFIDPGAYELQVWTSEKSLAPTPFSVEIDVEYI